MLKKNLLRRKREGSKKYGIYEWWVVFVGGRHQHS